MGHPYLQPNFPGNPSFSEKLANVTDCIQNAHVFNFFTYINELVFNKQREIVRC